MESRTIAKYQKRSLPWLKMKATFHFNAYIRQRDANEDYFSCTSCNSKGMINQMHAGHFYSGGHYPELKFNEDNVNGQCPRCNFFLAGNLIPYRRNLIRKIGIERVEKLDLIVSMARQSGFKWDRFFLIEIIEKYKNLK